MNMTADEVYSAIDSLVKIIRSSNKKDKVDAYLTLFTHFQKEKESTVTALKNHIHTMLPILQTEVKTKNLALAEAAISVVGQCLAVEEIVNNCDGKSISEVVQSLCWNLEQREEKSVFIRTFWCLSHQRLHEESIKNHIPAIVSCFMETATNRKSELAVCEGLKTMKRLCEQSPSSMELCIKDWFACVFALTVSVVPKIQEATVEMMDCSMHLLLKQQKYLSEYLLNQLNNKNMGPTLHEFYETRPVHVLNAWACVLRLLGKSFFNLDRVNVTNPLFKLAEKSFSSTKCEVSLALNNLWRSLIDCTFSKPGGFGKRMEKIFLLPLQIKHRNELVANESLKTNWHLVCMIDQQINDYMEKIIILLLGLHLSNDHCPTPEVYSKRNQKRSPFVVRESTKLLAVEMLVQLLLTKEERMKAKLKLEMFNGPPMSKENLLRYFSKFVQYVCYATKTITSAHEYETAQLWTTLLSACRCININAGFNLILFATQDIIDNNDLKTVWKVILVELRNMLESNNVMLTLKLLLFVPESIIPFRMRELESAMNKDGSVALYVIELLLNEVTLEAQGFDEERFFILYERIIAEIYKTSQTPLFFAQMVFSMLELQSSLITPEDIRWRLWSTMCILLDKHLSKTNDVNQGSTLEFKFPTLVHALMFPVEHMNVCGLSDGPFNQLISVWTDLYSTFNRSVDLLPGVEDNLSLQVFSSPLSKFIKTRKEALDSNKFSSLVLEMLHGALSNVNWTEPYNVGLITPSKIGTKLKNPLGNFKCFAEVVSLVVSRMASNITDGEPRSYEQLFLRLFRILELFFVRATSPGLLTEWTRLHAASLSSVLQITRSVKISSNVEKLLNALFGSFESNSRVVYHDDLLNVLEPILIAGLQNERKSVQTRVVKFWNSTFGKCHHLSYTETLKDAFAKCRSKVALLLLNHESIVMASDDESLQVASCPRLKTRPVGVSPVKIFGSFLRETNTGKQSPKSTKSPLRKTLLSSNDFVEIVDSPKRRRLLTERQKERIRERSALPVMYNNLDQSQDTSLFSALSQDQWSQDAAKDTVISSDVPKISHSSNKDTCDVHCVRDINNSDHISETLDFEKCNKNEGLTTVQEGMPSNATKIVESLKNENDLNAHRNSMEINTSHNNNSESTVVTFHKEKPVETSTAVLQQNNSNTDRLTEGNDCEIFSLKIPKASRIVSEDFDGQIECLKGDEIDAVYTNTISSEISREDAAEQPKQSSADIIPSSQLSCHLQRSLLSPSLKHKEEESKDSSPLAPIVLVERNKDYQAPPGKRKRSRNSLSCNKKRKSDTDDGDSIIPLNRCEDKPTIEETIDGREKSDSLNTLFAKNQVSSGPISRSLKFVKSTDASAGAQLRHMVLASKCANSPSTSPANGILKKKMSMDSPPSFKSRKVSFQLPGDNVLSKDDLCDLAKPLTEEQENFTLVKKRTDKTPVYPQLSTCDISIEKILPSLTYSRGISHLVRAQNILTVGDLSSLSESQIENLPIRSPKVATVRNALRTFSKNRIQSKSPQVTQPSIPACAKESTTPPKDETLLVKEAVLLVTPSRHFDDVKPTSLFSDATETSLAVDLDVTPVSIPNDDVTALFNSHEVTLAPKHFESVAVGCQTENSIEFLADTLKIREMSNDEIFALVANMDALKTKLMQELRLRCK